MFRRRTQTNLQLPTDIPFSPIPKFSVPLVQTITDSEAIRLAKKAATDSLEKKYREIYPYIYGHKLVWTGNTPQVVATVRSTLPEHLRLQFEEYEAEVSRRYRDFKSQPLVYC